MPEPRDIGEETQRFQAFQDQADDKTKAGRSKVVVIVVAVIVIVILAAILGVAF